MSLMTQAFETSVSPGLTGVIHWMAINGRLLFDPTCLQSLFA